MRVRLIAVLAVFLLAYPAHAAPSPIGNWLTEDRSGVIEIAPCGPDLCARIVGMTEPRDANGAPQHDVHGTPNCGLTILPDGAPTAQGHYEGHITDPSSGSVWRCTLWLDDAGRLNLRGYILVPLLGETQVWTRYAGQVRPACEMQP